MTTPKLTDEALEELIGAIDAEAAAAKEAARVRTREYAKWPAMPKRIPRNAVAISSLSPDEQQRISEQCARDMAPINKAEAEHRAARDRLADAVATARALTSSGPHLAPWYESDGSVSMLPAEEVERRRKAAAKVLGEARALVEDYRCNGIPSVASTDALEEAVDTYEAALDASPSNATKEPTR